MADSTASSAQRGRASRSGAVSGYAICLLWLGCFRWAGAAGPAETNVGRIAARGPPSRHNRRRVARTTTRCGDRPAAGAEGDRLDHHCLGRYIRKPTPLSTGRPSSAHRSRYNISYSHRASQLCSGSERTHFSTSPDPVFSSCVPHYLSDVQAGREDLGKTRSSRPATQAESSDGSVLGRVQLTPTRSGRSWRSAAAPPGPYAMTCYIR